MGADLKDKPDWLRNMVREVVGEEIAKAVQMGFIPQGRPGPPGPAGYDALPCTCKGCGDGENG